MVRIGVDEVLWKAPRASLDAPTTAAVTAWGWQTGSDGKRAEELAPAHGARLETGHKYVLALAWKEAECSGGDFVPARWAVIGSGGAVPADEQAIGKGEFQGEVVDSDVASKLLVPDDSVVGQFFGQSPKRIGEALSGLKPSADRSFRQEGARTCN